MEHKKFCVVWGSGIESYVTAMNIKDAISKVQADIRVFCPRAKLNIVKCYEVK